MGWDIKWVEGCPDHFHSYMDLKILIDVCVDCWVNIGR